jgi:hypothetical protein
VIDGTGGASFFHDNLAQARQKRRHFRPDPDGDVLARWIIQTFDFIQIMMIEHVVIGRKCGLDVCEVDNPPCRRIDLSRDVDLRREGVTVESSAFVAFGDVRQPVCRFKNELFEYLHTHEIIQQQRLWK